MKKFINSCIQFVLYVHSEYITEDFSVIKTIGKIVIYPAWFIRSILIWLISPIFIPDYLFRQTNLYIQSKKIMDSPEYQAEIAKSLSMFKF